MSHFFPDNCVNDFPYYKDFHPDYLEGYFSGNDGAFWPILIITIVVFLVWAEYGSQDCRNQTCNNKAPIIHPNDTSSEIIDKILYTVRKNHTIIGWRRSLLIAIFSTLLILILLYSTKMVHGFVFFIIAVIIFLVSYFTSAWFQSHWYTFNDTKIENSLKELRHRIYDMEIRK